MVHDRDKQFWGRMRKGIHFYSGRLVLVAFSLFLLSACAMNPIQSRNFSFSDRAQVERDGEEGHHFTYHLPQSALEISMSEDGKLDFTVSAVADATAAYAVFKRQPLFTRSVLAASDGRALGEDAEGNPVKDGLIDDVQFSTTTGDQISPISPALRGLRETLIESSAQLQSSNAQGVAPYQRTDQSDPYFYNAGGYMGDQQAPAIPEAKPAPFKTVCDDGVDFSASDKSKGSRKYVCSRLDLPPGYSMFAEIQTDFDLITPTDMLSIDPKQECLISQQKADNKCSAIFYRRKWPATVTVTLRFDPRKTLQRDVGFTRVAQDSSPYVYPVSGILEWKLTKSVLLYDTSIAYAMPIKGKALVGVTTFASFEDGELLYAHDDRPSTAARAILFPAELISSTVGLVVAVVSTTF